MASWSPQEQAQLVEMSRHFYYARKPEVPMSSDDKALLEVSLQKYFPKYEVEFLDDDQRLRISVPFDVMKNMDADDKFQLLMENAAAIKDSELLTFFYGDTIEEIKKMICTTQILISYLKRTMPSTAEDQEELKMHRAMLKHHEEALARENQILEDFKTRM
ncbi:hypothetical protein F52700_4526 [Fusarium sp. NRRL 52700]|nr:hypothetical protein F52700_4526 [Fusarium sp. NRRL 52700]